VEQPVIGYLLGLEIGTGLGLGAGPHNMKVYPILARLDKLGVNIICSLTNDRQ